MKITAGPHIIIDKVETENETEYIVRLAPEVEKIIDRLIDDVKYNPKIPKMPITLGDGSRLEFI